jgi:hypothetical protein
VCVVYLFAEFSVSNNVYSDYEFCDSTLILFLLFVLKFVAFFVISSISKNLSSENRSSFASFFSMKRKKIENWKKNYFYFLFFRLLLRQFINKELIQTWFFCFWNKFSCFVYVIVCFSEFKKERNCSRKKNKVSWKVDYRWRWCYEFLWNI